MELISASRIVKAQQRVTASQPYARQITRVISALASQSTVDHPLLQDIQRTLPPDALPVEPYILIWSTPASTCACARSAC